MYKAILLLAVCFGILANASDILEVDLVFPRNDSYAPAEAFPLIFAFQNTPRAEYLNPGLQFTIEHLQNTSISLTSSFDFRATNWSEKEDPFLVHGWYKTLRNEGQYRLRWTVSWQSCNEDALEQDFPTSYENLDMFYNSTTSGILFTISKVAPEVDLIAATAAKTCPGESGAMINVTGKTMKVPYDGKWSFGYYANSTCAVVANSIPTVRPDPCRVHIDNATVQRLDESLKWGLCQGIDPPADCPQDKKNAAQQLAGAGMTCLLALIGAVGIWLL